MFRKIKQFLFENRTAKQTVAKNTVWLSISNYGGRIIKAAIVIYGARALDTSGYGVFSYALTLAGFISLLLDPGINFILIRDSAKATEEERMSVFSTTFVTKIALVFIGIALVIFVAPSFSTLPGAVALLPCVALILSFDTFRGFFTSLLDSQEKMEWDAWISLLTNISVTVLGFLFLLHSASAWSFAWGYTIGTGIGAIVALLVVFPYLRRAIKHFSAERVLPLIKAAWPFAVIGALGLLLTNTDILILSWMRPASEVGVYSAAIRIVQVIYIIPGIVQTSTLPIFSRVAKNDPDRFRSIFERTLGFVLLASVPLALGGLILGAQVMTFVFGSAYASGGTALRVLMISMMFDFPAAIVAAAIFAHERQKGLIVSSAIAGIANVAFDLLFIPAFGMTGSAWATLLAQAISNWYLWHMMNRINHFSVIPKLKKVFVSGLVMAAACMIMYITHVHVLVNVVVSSAIYFLVLWKLREPLAGEIKRMIKAPANA